MQFSFCIVNLWNAVKRWSKTSREVFSQESYLLSSRIQRHREEQSLADSLALITDIRTIRFSALLSRRRKNEVLLLESATGTYSAFTGKRIERLHFREPASVLFYAVRMKSRKHQDCEYEECTFYNRAKCARAITFQLRVS